MMDVVEVVELVRQLNHFVLVIYVKQVAHLIVQERFVEMMDAEEVVHQDVH
jgi:hypothetical protein